MDMERLIHALLLLTLCALMAVASACTSNEVPFADSTPGNPTPMATSSPAPTPATPAEVSDTPSAPTQLVPTPRVLYHHINRIWRVSPSLEEQIFSSKVIVVASLLSATAGTETVPSDPGVAPTYRALQVLRFRAIEYLKGTGPEEAVVVVRGAHAYLMEAEARQAADLALSQRNTTWDSQRGVLFLNTTLAPATPGGTLGAESGSPVFHFTLSNFYVQSEWDYAIDTLSRAWLPARDSGGASGQEGDSSGKEFITDGAQSPPPVVSLADLRAKIAEYDALLKAGEGIEGYVGCIHSKILRERHRRIDPWTPIQEDATISSGLAAGTEVYRGTRNDRYPGYHNYWLSGPDIGLFRALIVDDDSQSNNGYDHALVTARPLPADEYRVLYNWQHYEEMPCNHVPTDSYRDWTVTVTAPTGTLHEAFFDPVAIGASVGADEKNGTLKPTAFTVGRVSTSLQSMKWQDGSVTLKLNTEASLTGYVLDFIALDGTVALSLDAASATVSGDTLTWTVASQPWEAGDQLMLRIRKANAAAIPSLDIDYVKQVYRNEHGTEPH